MRSVAAKLSEGGDEESLSEDERRAMRGSRFASFPSPPAKSSSFKFPKVAHPGGSVTTNKAIALAKFLQRKLETPSSAASLDPTLVEAAIKNAKSSLSKGTLDKSIRQVESFSGFEEEVDPVAFKGIPKTKKKKKNKKRKNRS